MTRARVVGTVALAAAFAAGAPEAAGAHASLVRTAPRDGAVLARAPASVRLIFDGDVRPGGDVRAIRHGGGSVLAGRPRLRAGEDSVIVIPLRRALAEGDYSVAWKATSDDGHELAGVLAFAVGVGRAPPRAALSVDTGPSVADVVARWLFLAGVLAAVGSVLFRLVVWRPALARSGERERVEDAYERAFARAFFTALVLAFVGASALGHARTDTRFGLVLALAALVAAVAATLVGVASAYPAVRPFALAAALPLVLAPTLSGHALDVGRSGLDVVADVLHVASAAVWVGGLLGLGVVLRVAGATGFASSVAARFSALALGSVAVLAATGLVRAFSELSAVGQLWSSGYGRVLVVKTAFLACLVVLGWLNRYRLVPALAAGRAALSWLRGSVAAELALLGALVIAVALLTDLRPGRERAAAAPVASATQRPPPLPSPDALVLARQDGERAVALAARQVPRGVALTTTVTGPTRTGVDGLGAAYSVDGGPAVGATTCGAGCYRAVVPVSAPRRVAVRLTDPERGRSTLVFSLGERWPRRPAGALVRRATRVFRKLRSIRYVEELASSPRNRVVSTFTMVAPDRLAYSIRGGSAAVVIGNRRWDRLRGDRWRRSPQQQPLAVPRPPWGAGVRNAALLGSGRVLGRPVWRVSFLDPAIPAWFEAAIDRRTHRTLAVRMTAAAHFMRHRYSGFNAPFRIEPPPGT